MQSLIIMMIITVRSLYLMARQQKSLAVSPALAVTFVLTKSKLTLFEILHYFKVDIA